MMDENTLYLLPDPAFLSEWFDLNEDDINTLAVATTYHLKQSVLHLDLKQIIENRMAL